MAGSDRTPKLKLLMKQIYASILEVVLESRCLTLSLVGGDQPSSSSANVHGQQSSAFNLVLGRFCPKTDEMEPWYRGICEPMVIEILYLQREGKGQIAQKVTQNAGKTPAQGSSKVVTEASGFQKAILLERWTVEFIQQKNGSSGKSEKEAGYPQLHKGFIGRYLRGAQDNQYRVSPLGSISKVGASVNNEDEATYVSVKKNFSILLRSLYSTARLLPAHNLSKLASTSSQSRFKIAFRILTAPPSHLQHDRKHIALSRFPLLDCFCGKLRLTVAYRRTVPVEEQKMSFPPPHIVMDYVGKADYHQLKQTAKERIAHVHSLPSARCLSSFKYSNLQVQQTATNETVSEGGHSWALIQPREFLPPVNEIFDCPFAINNEVQDRAKATKLVSTKSDGGVQQPQDDASLGSLFAIFGQSEPLRGKRENLFSHEPKRTASDSLNELQMYIDVKNELQIKCTYER